MKLLTVPQYARSKGISHQAVYDRIKRGTLATVKKKVEQIRIPVEDTDLECVKS